MATTSDSNLLERLARSGAEGDAEAWDEVAASTPNEQTVDSAKSKPANKAADPKLAALLAKISTIKKTDVAPAPASAVSPVDDTCGDGFVPLEPTSYVAAGLSESDVEGLIFKLLLGRGDTAGRTIAEQIRLPYVLVEETLQRLKNEQLLVYRGSAPMNDYVYQLPDIGRERARRLADHSSYFGAAPVALKDYLTSVTAQSLGTQHPTVDDLTRAFSDLLINGRMLERLGPAINSGRGLFLFGAPGNGKTSIAERVTKAFGEHIWLPRAIIVDGEILRLFDPMCHEEVPLDNGAGLLSQSRVDRRWVRIKRPTIVVGGELTMDALEVVFNPATGVSEAPLQLKSNCGTLVIDDFGRQRMSTDELLNRWIVPLEKRYDFLNLANGKKIQVPFDQLIIFSTNLEPKDLVDEAFLRRIPYKIEVVDPNEHEFRELFKIMCPKMGFEYSEEAVDHLLIHHYLEVDRPFRNCQPRDLLMQVRNHCYYQSKELELTPDSFDFAAENYFSVL